MINLHGLLFVHLTNPSVKDNSNSLPGGSVWAVILMLLTGLFFSTGIFAVEPTTFPADPQGPKTYPGTIWKPGQANMQSETSAKKDARKGTNAAGVGSNTQDKPVLNSKKTKKKPVKGQQPEKNKKPVRKSTQEAGGIVEPIMFR